MNKYEEKTFELASNIAKDNGLIIEEVEWVKENNEFILRVIADSDEGLDINQATLLNELLLDELDRLNFIPEDYLLEVTSPGLERELKKDEDIIKHINEYVHIDFNSKYNIEKNLKVDDIEGTLLDYSDEVFKLKVNLKGKIKEILVNKSDVKLIRLAIKF